MAEALAGKHGARLQSAWGQARAFHTVGTDRADKPPHQGRRGKEQAVVLEWSGCSGGKELALE
jgi:hypothetical protein